MPVYDSPTAGTVSLLFQLCPWWSDLKIYNINFRVEGSLTMVLERFKIASGRSTIVPRCSTMKAYYGAGKVYDG